MMDENEELDRLVAEAVQRIRAAGGKDTHRSVRAEVNRKTVDVFHAYSRFKKKEKAQAETELANVISGNIGVQIIKDREEYADKKTEALKSEIEQFEIACEVLSEDIVEINVKQADLENQLSSEQSTHAETVRTLDQSNSHLKGTLQSMHEQIDTLRDELKSSKKQRNDSAKKYSGLRETLVQQTAEAKSERLEANRLRQQIKDAITDRDKAKSSLEAAEKTADQSQGQISELTSQLKEARKNVSTENQLRIESEKDCAVSAAQVVTLKADLAALSKKILPPPDTEEKAKDKPRTRKRTTSTKL